MCGIVGAHTRGGSVVASLIQGLKTLEYRGYDSAGVGVVHGGQIEVRKRAGRLAELEGALASDPLPGAPIGIGHTRWATHGEPTDQNAHPHVDPDGRLALVHNGVIENYLELRRELMAEGAVFLSETDTEVLAHLIGRQLAQGDTPLAALQASLARVEGYYAIALLVNGAEPQLLCARHGPPLCVGMSADGAWLGSDVLALLPHTREIQYLEDGDVAELAVDGIKIVDGRGRAVERPVRTIEWNAESAEKGGYEHYMLKEIHEQPDVLARTLEGRLRPDTGDVDLGGEGWEDSDLANVERVQVVACGTALHAGYIARYMIEGLAGVPVDIDFASEFRYRDPRLVKNTMALAISQSGETADTLAALRLARDLGARPTSICNVVGSTVMRESSATLLTEAGPEIGVASTKAFVAQVVAAYLLALRMGRANGRISREQGREMIEELKRLRARMETVLAPEAVEHIRELADRHRNVKGFFFLGRGINFPIALEGALKLKEISYMHAEGYPAGEMKHGPIALIEPDLTTVVVNSIGGVSEKSRSNIEQVKARGGRVIAVGSDRQSHEIAEEAVVVPESSEWLSPVLNVIPLQLLAYHIADLRGCDIDKPRNLAKSVTVE
ncbi:glutamine--fructose-6-phosphate transaminase (isomerizing) [Engelhardtia mirabilis]|uniref:Glutamine--fructose-6-phosphate aminotransferase [isomerizing] n=1 Tax=Engelhardtia mirabilis TaxID=2528011 RepID=A0A518BKA9_9BACT|nr:Glutamine--fructose-6-phosphate aminotransferase [isomerizing] [Planctomycetes bacterium Pla133]QDV01740.1 Glutamine--fructose-6-phosphate aminotransferase [isomerizing] [Planctomycetes bacterium Pla86]